MSSQSITPEPLVHARQRTVPGKVSSRGSWLFILVAVLLILGAVISRRPDALFRAQFWAEDGSVWFSEAHNLGPVQALALPKGGDFQTFPRLAAAFALVFPLAQAPLVMNLLAILIQVAVPVFLLTERFAYAGNKGVRLLMAFLLLAVPTSPEVHANVTNSMTFLALLAFLVFVAEPPNNIAWRIFDITVICLSGATGPFAVFLLPIAVLVYWIRRWPWTRVLLSLQFCAAAVQAITIFRTSALMRSSAPRGATGMLLSRIFGGQLIVHPLLGLNYFFRHPANANVVCLIASAGGVLLVIYVLAKGTLELRLFVVFSGLLFAAALWSPQASLVQPQWQAMTCPGCAGRYWLIPVVAFSWCYVWLLGRGKPTAIRIVGVLAIVASGYTGLRYWRYQSFADMNFSKYAHQFEQTPVGQDLVIPINPGGWKVTLHKH